MSSPQPVPVVDRARRWPVSSRDEMWTQADHYFHVGLSALSNIERILGEATPRSVLDMPCGHGRVLRFLRARYPRADLTACDLNRDGVRFCAQTFGASAVHSVENPADLQMDNRFDLIWCGSLFTHLDAPRWSDFLHFFEEHLEQGGFLIFTTHGERGVELLEKGHYGVAESDIPRMRDSYIETGFSYADYPGQSAYGISIASEAWVRNLLATRSELELVDHAERSWDDHQDVVACTKPSG